MNPPDNPRILSILQEIRASVPELQNIADELRARLSAIPGDNGARLGADFWHPTILRDAVIRIRLFSEQNFVVVETLGLLAMARYVFELVVWLKHIEKDSNFALLYARFLMKQQVEFYEDLAAHLEIEAAMYDRLGKEEETLHREVFSNPANLEIENAGAFIAQATKSASQAVDGQLTTNFAIYSDKCEVFGYSYVAHLVRSKALIAAQANAQSCRETLDELNGVWRTTIDSLGVKKWVWEERAKNIGMANEYAFIYSYTSRMLHAHPHSLSTEQKNLEPPEMLLFLKYVEMQFRWIRNMAIGFLGHTNLH